MSVYIYMFYRQWRGAFWLVTLVMAMWPIPLAIRSIQSSLANVDPIYEEAALILGASPWGRNSLPGAPSPRAPGMASCTIGLTVEDARPRTDPPPDLRES